MRTGLTWSLPAQRKDQTPRAPANSIYSPAHARFKCCNQIELPGAASTCHPPLFLWTFDHSILYSPGTCPSPEVGKGATFIFQDSDRRQLLSLHTVMPCPASPSTSTIGLTNLFFIPHYILYLWRTLLDLLLCMSSSSS